MKTGSTTMSRARNLPAKTAEWPDCCRRAIAVSFSGTAKRPTTKNTMIEEPPIEHLYVHVPFCAKKCAYCAFYSEAGDGELINRYVEALVREMELVAEDLQPKTIFFGGGTPSLLNLRQWERILHTMHRLGWHGAEEWTVECNPA